MKTALLPTYKRFPQQFVRGENAYLWDQNDKKYIDFLSGVGVCNLGHAHPELQTVLQNQSQNLWHVSNYFNIASQESLAQKIVKSAFPGQVFFGNSGAEANEGALKLARKFSKIQYADDKTEVISFQKSFHGRTLWTLAVTGKKDFGKNFEPLPPSRNILPFNDPEALDQITKKTAAVIVELIQGEAGVHPADKSWIQALRKQCDKHHVVLIFDEVQTGVGRTGKTWAFQHYDTTPDIMTFAKGIGNGFPLGGFLVASDFCHAFGPGDHGSTFGGNPLGTSIGTKVLEIVDNQKFLETIEEKGSYFKSQLQEIAETQPHLELEIRGKGLMIGLTGKIEAPALVAKALAAGFIFNAPSAHTLRFIPPLTIDKSDIKLALDFLKKNLS